MRRAPISLLIPLLLIPIALGADKGPTVKQIYENFRKVYLSSKNFQADFEEVTYLGGRKSTAKGRLIFARPNLLRKEYFDPKDPSKLAQLIILDGKTAWSYTPWLGQVTKQEMRGGKELLPGVGETFEKLLERYEVKLVPDEAANKKGVYKAEIRPKPELGGSKEYLEVWIDGKLWVPVQIAYHNPENKTTTIITFKNIKIDQKLDPSTFKFTPPEGVEVITVNVGR